MTADTTKAFRAVYPEVAVGGLSRYDGTVEFYTRVRALLTEDSVVLDFGAGRGRAIREDPVRVRRELQTLRGDVAEIIGVDVDEAVLDNPGLDRSFVEDPGAGLPLEDESIDLVLSDFVFEHIQDPQATARELLRVLRPGGWICARTPNRIGYVGLGARLVANRHHVAWLQRLQPTKREQDTFPTVYRLNSPRQIEEAFPGCQVIIYPFESPPQYGGNSPLAIRVLASLSKLLPSSLSTTLLVFVHKAGDEAAVTPPGPPIAQSPGPDGPHTDGHDQ